QPPVAFAVPVDKTAVAIVVGQAPEQPGAPQTRKVIGRVVDPETKEPVAGAQILVPANGQVIFTEIDGSYVVEDAPLGPFEIEVSAGGREARSVQVPAGEAAFDVPLAIVEGEQIVIEGRAPAILKQNLANGASVIDDEHL